jgi:transposase
MSDEQATTKKRRAARPAGQIPGVPPELLDQTMDKIGSDVHKVKTQVCVLTETGEYAECRIRTERDALSAFFGERPKARILLEAATESEWVARHLESLGHEVIVVDKKVAEAVKDDQRVQRLTTVPSAGPVTAATFIAIVDNVGRFESSHKLQSYVGLVPREYSSGEKQQRGHITKAGNNRLRVLLVECAWGILRRSNPQSEPLAQWAQRIAERRGKRIAAVALARKLAGILFAMTKNARSFEPDRLRRATPAQAA